MPLPLRSLAPVLALALLVAGCGGGGGGGGGGGSPAGGGGGGGATRLRFGVAPSSAQAGEAIAPAVTVLALDAAGAVDAAFAGPVTVALAPGSPPAALGGTRTVSATAGAATFADLSIPLAGSGYALLAKSGALASTTSATFAIAPAAADALFFTAAPSSAQTGLALSPAPAVVARDRFGNLASSFTGAVSVTLAAGSPAAALQGATSVSATAGAAAFPGLALDAAGTGFRLLASSGALGATTSAAFGATTGTLSRAQLSFTSAAAGSLTAVTLVLETTRALPSAAAIALAFPAGYDAGAVASPSVAGLDGAPSFGISAPGGGLVLLSIAGGATPAGRTITATFAGLRNPPTAGLISGVPVRTENGARAPIEAATANGVLVGPGALAGVTLALDTRAPAVRSTAALSFTLANPWPSNGRLFVAFPAGFDVSAASATITAGTSGGLSAVASGQNLTLSRTGGAAASAGATISVAIAGIGNPQGPLASGTFLVQTRVAGLTTIDAGAAPGVTIAAGAITASASFVAGPGARGTLTLDVTPQDPWPADGRLAVSLPAALDASGAAALASASGGDGAFSVAGGAGSLTITRGGGATLAGGTRVLLSVTGVADPTLSGAGGAVALETRSASGVTIDAAPAALALTVEDALALAVEAGTLATGAASPMTITVTTTHGWPADGALELTFPAGTSLGAVESVEGVSGLGGGGFGAPSVAGSTLTVARAGGAAVPAGGAFAVRIDAPRNGPADGVPPGAVTARTLAGGGAAIDAGAGAPAGLTFTRFLRSTVAGGGGGADALALADLDGAGLPDLAATSGGLLSVYACEVATPGAAIAFAPPAQGAAATASLAAGDLDGDGLDDLVSLEGGALRLHPDPGDGTPGASLEVETATAHEARAVAIADVDGDGRPDVLAAVHLPSDALWVERSAAPTGTPLAFALAAFEGVAGGGDAAGLAVGDLDGDGRPDAAIARGAQVDLFRNATTASALVAFTAAALPLGGVAPDARAVAIADVDGDGRADLVVTDRGLERVLVLRNVGAPGGPLDATAFAPLAALPIAGLLDAGGPAPAVAVADLDSDGRADLALACRDRVRIWWSGGADATAREDYALEGVGGAALAADLNGDGLADIAVAMPGVEGIAVLERR